MELAALAVGVVLGGLIGWLVAASRQRAASAQALREARESAVSSAAQADALRGQLDAREREIREIRGDLSRAHAEKASAEMRAGEMGRGLEEQRRLLDEARQKLSDAFKSVAADALRSNNESFLTLAGQRLDSERDRSVAELEARRTAIEHIVAPIKETLQRLDGQIREIEKERGSAYSGLSEQVKLLIDSQGQLRSETANLVKALRAPVVRGRWGEIQLKRVVEMAGMIDHCDFHEQESVATDDGRLRPDMIVRLPGGKNIVVDAKAPLQAYLEALEAPSDMARAAKLRDHAQQVRNHMAKLSAKGYWEHLSPTPEFVVLFLPGETFFSAALEQDPSLIEQGVSQRVILATPTTLIALLRAVAYGWRQEHIAENAQAISALGQELYERIATMVQYLARLRAALNSSVTAFNQTVGALQERVLPSMRKFKELGIAARKELEQFDPIDSRPREVPAAAPDNVLRLRSNRDD